jgi:glucan biosynthesis protein
MNTVEIIEKLKDKGFDPTSYSGRGMFGKRCVSVYVRPNEIWKEAEVVEIVGARPTTDSMGKGIVVYWPNLEWPEGLEEDD